MVLVESEFTKAISLIGTYGREWPAVPELRPKFDLSKKKMIKIIQNFSEKEFLKFIGAYLIIKNELCF